MSEVSDPAIEWEYRNITCRVYRLEPIRTLAYAKVGDVWVNVYDDDGREPESIQVQIESEVDQLLDNIRDTDVAEWPWDKEPEPIEPQPLDPDPIDPDPLNPYDPRWFSTLNTESYYRNY